MKVERGGVSADVTTRAIADWTTVLPAAKLQPDHLHEFRSELASGIRASHVRLNIYPDGGVSRFRVFGTPDAEARRLAVLRQLNAMDEPELRATLADFCGAPAWIDRMAASRPFATPSAVLAASDAAAEAVDARRLARGVPSSSAHRRARGGARAVRRRAGCLGARAVGGRRTPRPPIARPWRRATAPTKKSSATSSSSAPRARLPPEMLAMLRERLKNDPDTELRAAAAEQRRDHDASTGEVARVTISTHVLDTSIGRPAAAVTVHLQQQSGARVDGGVRRQSPITTGACAALLPSAAPSGAGGYRLTFDVGDYFRARGVESFYTSVSIDFLVRDTDGALPRAAAAQSVRLLDRIAGQLNDPIVNSCNVTSSPSG